jgi:glycine/D-amino acid oxidase-like deaminating enzyme
MAPPVVPVRSDQVMPVTTHVVVGGGIIGACTTFFLARRGVPVVLCEKGEIAAEQSSRN